MVNYSICSFFKDATERSIVRENFAYLKSTVTAFPGELRYSVN